MPIARGPVRMGTAAQRGARALMDRNPPRDITSTEEEGWRGKEVKRVLKTYKMVLGGLSRILIVPPSIARWNVPVI